MTRNNSKNENLILKYVRLTTYRITALTPSSPRQANALKISSKMSIQQSDITNILECPR